MTDPDKPPQQDLDEFLGVEPNPIPVKAVLALQGIGHGLRLP